MLGFSVGQTMQSTKERIKNHIFIKIRPSPIIVGKAAFQSHLPEAKLKFRDAT